MWHFVICAKGHLFTIRVKEKKHRGFWRGLTLLQSLLLLSTSLCFVSLSFSCALITFMCSLTPGFFLHVVNMSPRLWRTFRDMNFVDKLLSLYRWLTFFFCSNMAEDSWSSIGSCETPAPNTKGVDYCATDNFSEKTILPDIECLEQQFIWTI